MLNTVVFIWSVLDLPQVCESHTSLVSVSVNSLVPTTLESKVGGFFSDRSCFPQRDHYQDQIRFTKAFVTKNEL